MIIQFEILQAQADRILAVVPSLGFVYNPEGEETEEQQKWTFFMNYILRSWDSEVFNYERSLAIADEPNDTAADQALRYEEITTEILHDKESNWVANQEVKIGMVRLHNSKRYVVVQDHTTQVGWEPDKVPALFVEKPLPNPGELYPPWIQPTGAHDAYTLGARVTHNSSNWESQYAANVWEPGVFGWIVI